MATEGTAVNKLTTLLPGLPSCRPRHRKACRRLSRKLPLLLSCLLLALFVCLALFPGLFAPYSPDDADLARRLLPASSEHWLGTDHQGRDVLSCLIYGARASLGSVALIAIFIVLTGFVTGAVSGWLGGWVDALTMRICELFMTFQTFILAMFLAAVLGRGLTGVIIAIVLTHWAWYSRMVRGMVLSLKNREYVLAARVAGGGRARVFLRHVAPPVLAQLLILASLDLGHMMLHVSGLSFLGLGIQPPTPEWGVMINDARAYIWSNPGLVVLPGLMIFLTVLACNIPADYLRDKLDPSLPGLENGNGGRP